MNNDLTSAQRFLGMYGLENKELSLQNSPERIDTRYALVHYAHMIEEGSPEERISEKGRQITAKEAASMSRKNKKKVTASLEFISERIEACALAGKRQTEPITMDGETIEHLEGAGFEICRQTYSNIQYIKW